MNTEKMTKKHFTMEQITLALVLSTVALQVSAESINFEPIISIAKEDQCGVKVTSEGTDISGTILIEKSGLKTLTLTDTGNATVTAEATGGDDCRIGTAKLDFQHGNVINGSPALTSSSSSVYFPFDYALGLTQVTNEKGEMEEQSKVFDSIYVNRYQGENNTHPVQSFTVNSQVIPGDKVYHGHKGQIVWQTNGKEIYLDKKGTPFWIGSVREEIVFQGGESKKASFSFIPVTSKVGYDKSTGNISNKQIDDGDTFSYRTILTLTTI